MLITHSSPVITHDYVKALALPVFHRFNSSLPSNISKADVIAIGNHGSNKSLITIRPDKGNGVALLTVLTMFQR